MGTDEPRTADDAAPAVEDDDPAGTELCLVEEPACLILDDFALANAEGFVATLKRL